MNIFISNSSTIYVRRTDVIDFFSIATQSIKDYNLLHKEKQAEIQMTLYTSRDISYSLYSAISMGRLPSLDARNDIWRPRADIYSKNRGSFRPILQHTQPNATHPTKPTYCSGSRSSFLTKNAYTPFGCYML